MEPRSAGNLEDKLRRRLLERTRGDLRTMRKALAAGDCGAVRQLSHRLRGAAGALEFDRLSEIASKLEAASKSASLATISQLLAELDDELGRTPDPGLGAHG